MDLAVLTNKTKQIKCPHSLSITSILLFIVPGSIQIIMLIVTSFQGTSQYLRQEACRPDRSTIYNYLSGHRKLTKIKLDKHKAISPKSATFIST